jgi:hypothetical protein
MWPGVSDSLPEKKVAMATGTPMNGKSMVKTVCVCEFVEMENNNSIYGDMVLLAQANDVRGRGSGLRLASQALKEGKRKMKEIDFDRVHTLKRVIIQTDCTSFLQALRKEKENIRVYEVLDATASR